MHRATAQSPTPTIVTGQSNGSANYRNSSCAELQASANYITYDLGSVKSIANLYYSFVTDLAIGVAFSTDGVSYTSGTTISFTGSGTKYGTVTLSPTVTARYIRGYEFKQSK